ncbi:MAG TPA: FAD-dependent oxidoreductase, partial [Bryobacteraceae bacterium]
MDRHPSTFVAVFLSAAVFLGTVAVPAAARDYTIVDVQKVPLNGDAAAALVHISVPERVAEREDDIRCDALIAGAGMGGIAAALALDGRGRSVCLTEETDWVGGQATAGGVPALDENRFIEFSGATRSYRQFRNGIREWYRQNRALTPAAREWENLNPGSCYVSALCFEPAAGLAVLQQMLERTRVRVLLRTAVFAIERRGNTIESALAWQFDRRTVVHIRPRFVLDATEMGDLLPLAGVPYVVGSEAKADTAEPDAGEAPNHACVQSFTYPFVLEHGEKPAAPAAKPADYDAIVKRQGFSLRVYYPEEFGWKGWVAYRMFGEDPPVPNNMSPGPFFGWRRIAAARNFASGMPNDLALINWPRQDYAEESPLDQTASALARILQNAKQTSQAFLYWLQHDVAREGGGKGYPELALRPEVMGTADGLSKYPYIRESRRMLAQGRVTEQDIVEDLQPGPRARWFGDSVGTGFYMVD